MKIDWPKASTELLIIIAGVLIALWIGELRQGFLDRNEERDYLQRLELDLNQDLDEIERVTRHSEGRIAAARKALAFLDSAPGSVQLQDVIEDFDRAGYITFFAHARSTWDDLQATGNLRLISDSALRQSLSRYYRSTRFIDEFDQSKIDEIWHEYRTELDYHLSPLLVLRVRAAEDVTSDLRSVDQDSMRTSKKLRIKLEKVIAMASLEQRMVRNLGDQTRTLLDNVSAKLAP